MKSKYFIFLVDLIIINSILLAYGYSINILLVAIIILFFNKAFLLYQNYVAKQTFEQFFLLLKSFIYSIIIISSCTFFWEYFVKIIANKNKIFMLVTHFYILSLTLRILYAFLYKVLYKGRRNLVILTKSKEVLSLHKLIKQNNPEFNIKAILTDKIKGLGSLNNVVHKISGKREEVLSFLKKFKSKYILVGNFYHKKEKIQ